MKLTPGLRGMVLAVALLGASNAGAQAYWEAGIGVAALHLPDYRGADETHDYLLPFPYLVYRSERLRIDRSGIVARVFGTDRLELDASFTGNFALRSSGNRAREGMPPLHPMVEGGPELVYRIAGPRDRHKPRLDLRMAARAAFAVGGGRVSHEGWTLNPYLRLEQLDAFGSGFEFSATLGLLYGDRRYHDYLYSVAPSYATAARPAYDAPGGYAGIQSQLGAGRRFGRLWVGGYLRLDSLNGSAALEGSPLVRSHRYFSAGIAATWLLGGSGLPEPSGD